MITNIEYMVRTAETTMGITVFFDENLTEDEIKDIGAKIESDKSGMIKEINSSPLRRRGTALRQSISVRTRPYRKDLRMTTRLQVPPPTRSD